VIKLNTNESPYPPAPGVAEALQGQDAGLLRLYPDPEASQLTCAIAKRYGLSPDRVFVGVGSDDVLSISFLTFEIRANGKFETFLGSHSSIPWSLYMSHTSSEQYILPLSNLN
jgi:histidinol-phosphate/aromatic aminotransferase/cobyric acid decarboxylase-like protein